MAPDAADNELHFRCVACGGINVMTPSVPSCAKCGVRIVDAHGVFHLLDTSSKIDERAFYDNEYVRPPGEQPKAAISLLRQQWERYDAPQNRLLRNIVGDLSGKTVLLVGNGGSVKELTFLEHMPRWLVYSDLSARASQAIQARFDFQPYSSRIRFAAIDAENLPFDDAIFDVVYGYAMVHHLPDVERFLKGAHRVLKPGGQAIFTDDAFSPVWHYSKQTWLKPLMKYSHQRTGISPEDYRFSMSGGFRENELEPMMTRLGTVPFFHRISLLDYIWTRGIEKLLPRSMYGSLTSGAPMRAIAAVDKTLGRLSWYRKNQIRLVWGFNKPW